MKKHLTIGEFADLMNISAHSIRYYEKEGLLTPNYQENGYRQYDLEDAYILSTILLLRENDISLIDIKELFKDYKGTSYRKLLEKSHEKILKKMEKLSELKNNIEDILEKEKTLLSTIDNLFISDFDSFCIYTIDKDFDEKNLNLTDMYNLVKEKNIDINHIYKKDLYFLLSDNNITLGIKGVEGIKFEKGKYLTYRMIINEGDNFDKVIRKSLKNIYLKGYKISETFIFRLNAKLSMFIDNGDLFEILIKLS